MTDAELCRRNGWGPGTVLEGTEGRITSQILITAVGEDRILAREIRRNGRRQWAPENGWTLACRDWREVKK